MSLNEREILTNKNMRDLVGAPPLIKGEDEEHYWNLWYAFEEDIKPKRLPEWIMLYDLVCKYWERLRLRRFSPALIEGACAEALTGLLQPYLNYVDSSDVARNYYADDAEAKKEAIRSVEKY